MSRPSSSRPRGSDVWISPYRNGHIQAVGTDDAGRRQYLYHDAWHEARGREKHDRVLQLAKRLPDARKHVASELRESGFSRRRVTAAGLRMLDAGLFRSGGDEYESEHGSHGVATLLRSHVAVSGEDISFEFPAKSGQLREAVMSDQLLARIVLSLKRSSYPGERLLAYRDDLGWHELHSSDLNAAFKEIVGEEFTVKDLRTWAATVTAAVSLAQIGPSQTEREVKRAEKDTMKVVSSTSATRPRWHAAPTSTLGSSTSTRWAAPSLPSLRKMTKADRERLRGRRPRSCPRPGRPRAGRDPARQGPSS